MEDACDAEVIRASITDPGRFATIYDRHAAVLFRFLVRRIGSDVGEELLGDTFRIAFERRSSFDVQWDSARPWLYGIATNLIAKQRRSEGRRLRAIARITPARDVEGVADRVAAAMDAHHTWNVVANAIADLPDGERDALLLFAWEACNYDEIAVALGVPVGTVRSRLNRARRRLRELASGSGEPMSNSTQRVPRTER
jgi:RNA polymerase sigma-70 factor (ECF subfamily)